MLDFNNYTCNIIGMNGNKYLKKHIEQRGLTISEVARLTGLSQGLVSMHLSIDGKSRRGIGVKAANAYHEALSIPLDVLLKREESRAA